MAGSIPGKGEVILDSGFWILDPEFSPLTSPFNIPGNPRPSASKN
jgi:hypothetical protein